MEFRAVTSADVDAVTDTIRLAFMDDPVWGPCLVLPDGSTEHLDPFWRLFVEGGMRFSTAFVTGEIGGIAMAIAVWTPPGEAELSDEQEKELDELVRDTFPPELAAKVIDLFDRFEAAHPRGTPHAYLGLLATHPDYRGRGIGQQLLAANLVDWDARGIPCYLESTNPANLHRYRRAGFESVGTFDAVLNDAIITTMWHAAAR
jgi:ribosomal protein S18 acetylase RimI-like enzyme